MSIFKGDKLKKLMIKAGYLTPRGQVDYAEIRFDLIVIVGITALAVGSWVWFGGAV